MRSRQASPAPCPPIPIIRGGENGRAIVAHVAEFRRGSCHYCGAPMSDYRLSPFKKTKDDITPRSRGGLDHPSSHLA